jgi:hypothetical protein
LRSLDEHSQPARPNQRVAAPVTAALLVLVVVIGVVALVIAI